MPLGPGGASAEDPHAGPTAVERAPRPRSVLHVPLVVRPARAPAAAATAGTGAAAHGAPAAGASAVSGARDAPPAPDGDPSAAPDPAPVSALRALAGAGLAVAGVVLGIGALLTVTGAPEELPLAGAQVGAVSPEASDEGPVPEESLSPEDLAPAVVPTPVAPPRAAAPRETPRAARAPVVVPTEPATPVRPPVVVLNNSTRSGLADRASARFARNGWPVALTGNFRGRLRATTAYYEPGQRASAERFAATFRGIDRVLPRAENIPGPRGLVVVLTRDFPA